MEGYIVALITAPVEEARQIAENLVKSRAAACVNIVPNIASVYWWKGKIETAEETLLVAKTTVSKAQQLIDEVRKSHPYTVPEIIFIEIAAGYNKYLEWVKEETSKKE